MHKILFLLPDLHYRGASQQVGLLAAGLRRYGLESRVCALGDTGPVADVLHSSGVACTALGWRRWFDGRAFLTLRQLLHEYQPDIIHSWGSDSLRLGWMATVRARLRCVPRFVCSGAAAGFGWSWLTQLDQWLLRRVEHVQVLPGVALTEARPRKPDYDLPRGARFVVCVGPVEPRKGFRTAIWALDILRYIYRDLQLVIVGQGSDIPRLREFARSIRVEQAVHFLGPRTEVAALMHAAEMVWVPTLTSGGSLVALEAMAAGRPVVASAVGELPEIVADGTTGFLMPPHDPVALARRTRQLLDEETLLRAQGAAGRERVRQAFTDGHLVQRFAEVYNAPTLRSLRPAA